MRDVSYRARVAMFLVLALSVLTLTFIGVVACGVAPAPQVVTGPGVVDNTPPTLEITSPIGDVTVSRGQAFLITWTDSDRDDAARIGFAFVNANTNEQISLVENIEENDDLGPDQYTVGTDLIPEGDYYLRGTINDFVNTPVVVFAEVADSNQQRARITIAPKGQGPPTTPPQVVVVQPAFNQSVAETDVLEIRIQPTPAVPTQNTPPYDSDSPANVFILLDTDDRPNNDDPANPDDSIIVLREQTIQQGQREAIPFNIVVDLNEIPPRVDGTPYFIRATITDSTNPPVHAYAAGTISVVSLAAGAVDLADIGRTLSGVRFYGFTPGAHLGSSVSGVGDFDSDGVADFVMVAQFGNPRNLGRIGEAYLAYGQLDRRFGGAIAANSISDQVSGIIFEAPPIRQLRGNLGLPNGLTAEPNPESKIRGITDVARLPDMNGDGRPEIIFGLAHVHGAWDSMDYDAADDALSTDEPDSLILLVRQGHAQYSLNGADPVPVVPSFYDGTSDLVISSCTANCENGSADVPNGALDLSYNNNGVEDTQWVLIKFADLLDVFAAIQADPGDINIPDVTAQLSLRIFNQGGSAQVFQAITNFSEQTTFNNFSVQGDAPVPDVDYIATGRGGEGSAALGEITADESTTVTVDVSGVVRDLLENTLLGSNNELRFILVPTSEFSDPTGIRSSEYPSNELLRPTLTINFERRRTGDAAGCFPDDLGNNTTDPLDTGYDTGYYGGGMAVVVSSTNRDRAGFNDVRLENAVVTLELVGQEGASLGNNVFPRVDNSAAENTFGDPQFAGRIAGFRLCAGLFDFINHRQVTNEFARNGWWGENVASIADMNQDGLDEIIVSAPNNEQFLASITDPDSTTLSMTEYPGSIAIIRGGNYYALSWRDKAEDGDSTATLPNLDQQRHRNPQGNFGACSPPAERHLDIPGDSFNIFAEAVTDGLGDGQSAGDVNLDGIEDILAGAPFNNRPGAVDSGAVYIIEGRNVFGDVRLSNADDPLLRPPMVRIRGLRSNDRIGHAQSTGLDINGDRLDDIFISSPHVDFAPVTRVDCAADYNGDNIIGPEDLNLSAFDFCQSNFGDEVFTSDDCKAFDYNNDSVIDGEDLVVLQCLIDGGANCCSTVVDNGYVGVIFGGITIDGDFDIDDVATTSLPGTIFYGSQALDRAGMDVSSAGDFNEDGFGDLLITAPGRIATDPNGRLRKGLVYLIFGGTHLQNRVFDLALVGTPELPGIVFYSPYVTGRPNEAAPDHVALLGDINNDGFDDIAIGNTRADFINLNFPQGPDAPVDDAGAGRRRDTGDVYVIYGNNFGTNRANP